MAEHQNQRQAAGALLVEGASASVPSGGSRRWSVDSWSGSQPPASTPALSDNPLYPDSPVTAILLWLLKVPIPIIILFALLF